VTLCGQTLLESLGESVDAQRNVLQALGAMVNSVEGSGVGQERLSSANVGVCLLPADVLLTSLECKTVGLVARGVPALANHTSGNSALVLVPAMSEKEVSYHILHKDNEMQQTKNGTLSHSPTRRHVPASQESSVGSSVSEGDTEALGVSDNNVDAELAGGLEDGEGEQVGNENGVDLVLLLTFV
jgi:hypothetical protein